MPFSVIIALSVAYEKKENFPLPKLSTVTLKQMEWRYNSIPNLGIRWR
jgi:hypothetical protein